jgi:hypothetical protein
MGRFYIYKEPSMDNQLNDKYTTFPNIIFDNILKKENPLILPYN